MKNTNLIIVLIAVGVIGFIIIDKNKKATDIPQNTNVDDPTPIPTNTTTIVNTIVLDGTKLLKKGSTGFEVKELQKRLGVSQDGSFGAITETALFNKKGVKQITLNNYDNLVNSVPHKFSVGSTVTIQNAPTGVKVFNYNNTGNNTYVLNGNSTILNNNNVAGKVVKLTTGSDGITPSYIIENQGVIFSDFYAISEKYLR